MRKQPQDIIKAIASDNSRLAKEEILSKAAEEGLNEFFDGLRMALDKLHTFGVKDIPVKETNEGQGLPWEAFIGMAHMLRTRALTGHAARDAIQISMDTATQDQWNDWYRLILQKDFKAGFSEKTVNKVLKKYKDIEPIPVFECMLAHDGANHESKITGKKLVEPKLDGVRCLTIIDFESKTTTQYTRNGHVLENFTHITDLINTRIEELGRSWVLDGEVVSDSFNSLMKQVHRKDNVQAQDARLVLFDAVPLLEFKAGKSVMGLRRRRRMLEELVLAFEGEACIEIVPQVEFDLDVLTDRLGMEDYVESTINQGYEGVVIKDFDSKYECKRSTSWLKQKPFIEVSLEVTGYEEGTGRNVGRLGAIVCTGLDDGKQITVNVGSGFSDDNRVEFWDSRDSLIGQVVEVRADAVSQNQDGTYSLRFPRFKTFRGFKVGEKI